MNLILKELLLDIFIFPIVFVSRFPVLFLTSFFFLQASALTSNNPLSLYIHILGLTLGFLISLFGIPDLDDL